MDKKAFIPLDKRLIILVGIILILVFVFNFGKQASIVDIKGIPIQTGDFSFAGHEGTYETPYLGCLTSNRNQVINNGNDGDTTVCNSLDGGETLYLKSSIKEQDQTTSNYIQTKITLPAGTLTANFDYDLYSYYSTPRGYIYFTVGDETKRFYTPSASGKGHSLKGSGSLEIVLEKEQTVEISIREGGYTGKFDVGGSMNVNFEESVPEIIAPTPPAPKGFFSIIQSIITWLKNLFSGIFSTASIVGSQSVQPNTQHTYEIDLSASTPDSDWSDGTYQIQYSNWALVDSDGNIKQEGSWEEVNGRYQKSVTITTPSDIGEYVLLAVITQYDMTFNSATGTWTTSEEKIINKEAIDLKTEYTVEKPSAPTPSGFPNFISSIINWLKSIWNAIFG